MTDQALVEIVWGYVCLRTPLQKADILLGFGSFDIGVAEKCAELFHEGYAEKILFCGNTGRCGSDDFTQAEAFVFRDKAVELGVPGSAILCEVTSTNFGENIRDSYELLKSLDMQPKIIIAVSTPFATRRAFASLEKQWPAGNAAEFMVSAKGGSLTEMLQRGEPWSLDFIANMVTGEMQRIIDFSKTGYGTPQIIPDEVVSAYEELVKRGFTTELII